MNTISSTFHQSKLSLSRLAQQVQSGMASSVLLYSLALITMKGLSLVMLPITTRYLAPAEIGQLEIIAISCSLLGIMLSLSLHEALYRFAGPMRSKAKLIAASQLVSFTLVCSSLIAVIGVVLLTFFNVHHALGVSPLALQVAVLSLCIEGALVMGFAWLRMKNRAAQFCTISVSGALLQATLVVVFLELGFGIVGFIFAGAVAHAIQLVVLWKSSDLSFALVGLKRAKRYLAYSLPIMLSGVCAFGLNGAERFWVLEAGGLTQLGYYAIAAKFSLAMCILVQPFGMWWMPKRFAIIARSPQQACNITQLGMALVSSLAIAVYLIATLAIDWLLTDEFQQATTLLAGTLFMVLGKEASELVNLSLLEQKKTQWLFRINLVATLATLALASFAVAHGVIAVMIVIGCGQLLRSAAIYLIGQLTAPLPYKAILVWSPLFIATFTLMAMHLTSAITSKVLIALLSTALIAWTAKASITGEHTKADSQATKEAS